MLRDLFTRIVSTEADVLKQRCLLYYIKKDMNEEAASEFCNLTAFPSAHRKLIDGVYALDRFDFEVLYSYSSTIKDHSLTLLECDEKSNCTRGTTSVY